MCWLFKGASHDPGSRRRSSAQVGSEVAARLLAALAAAVNESRTHDSARAGYNLCLLFSALFLAGLTTPLLVWCGASPCLSRERPRLAACPLAPPLLSPAAHVRN